MKKMKIAVIGAGFTGLSAAYQFAKKGHAVSVFEKDSQPGGLAVGFAEKGWDWPLEAFYHHWFLSDKTILRLADELSIPVIVKRPKTSHLIDGKIFQLDSPQTLWNFKRLSVPERIQMGLVLGLLRFNPFWKPLEQMSASSFLSKTIGKNAYTLLWEPLLAGKFGSYADDISLAWFWARIATRTTSLVYPKGGFLRFAQALAEGVTRRGGVITYNANISSITSKNGKVSLGAKETYDKLVVTLPASSFLRLAGDIPPDYREKAGHLKGLGFVALILRLRKKLLTDNTYWLSVCDTKAPVLAVVEHTNFMDPGHYNNEHLVYLGSYVPQGHPYFSMSDRDLLAKIDPFLKTINGDYKKSLIGLRKVTVPFAQPIIPVNYSSRILPFKTPLENVYLGNMQQVYPYDRGTNYAVVLGQKVANIIMGE